MNISKFSIEDFVYNPEFRKWVLTRDRDATVLWERILLEYPEQQHTVQKAREILLKMDSGKHGLPDSEYERIWSNIEMNVKGKISTKSDGKIIPLYSSSVRIAPKRQRSGYSKMGQFYRIAMILIFSIGIGTMTTTILSPLTTQQETDPIVFEEHTTPKGVKSHLSLADGSHVILNAGSSIRYVKGFEDEKREVILEGEAFFDVFKDPQRPFIVRKGDLHISALGTSFNVKAYENEAMNISLVTGKIGIGLEGEDKFSEVLEIGENLIIHPQTGKWTKGTFKKENVLSWTNKVIVFDKTSVAEAIRVLENWYGTSFVLENQPSRGLLISGKFENETLVTVMKGLSYTTKLQFEIKEEKVHVKF